MLNEQTKTKLRKMKMQPVIDAAESLGSAPGAASMSHDEWMSHVVDHLYEVRMANRLANLVRGAEFAEAGAFIEDICLDADRQIDVGLIDKLVAGDYIARGHNLIIQSATGGGKTWLACALGLAACRQFRKTLYVNCRDMVDRMRIAREEPRAHKRLVNSLSKADLLIVDDWLLLDTRLEDLDELFAVVDRRSRSKKSIIVCTQYLAEGWPARMGGYPAAESIVDRIKHNAYVIELKGEKSMRERFMDEEVKRNGRA